MNQASQRTPRPIATRHACRAFAVPEPARRRSVTSRPARYPLAASLLAVAGVLLLAGCSGALRRVGLGSGGSASRAPSSAATHANASRPAHEAALAKNVREAREAAALAPTEPYWPYHVAELFAGADSMSAAEEALSDALARDPAYAPALALRSSLDDRAGRHAAAIRMLEGALARPGAFPNGPPRELLESLALHYDALGEHDRAAQVLATAPPRKGAPSPALVYLTLASARPEQAAPLAEAAVKNDPRSAVNQNNWGIALLRNGDPIAARRSFEWATKLDPKLAGPWYNLAIVQKYYLFDDSTAALSFAESWQRSRRDPDGLATIFGRTAKKPLAQDGE